MRPGTLESYSWITEKSRRAVTHRFRHYCATLLLARRPPGVIHSQIAVTMNLYAHVIAALRKEVAGQMDAILAPPAGKEETAAEEPVA